MSAEMSSTFEFIAEVCITKNNTYRYIEFII